MASPNREPASYDTSLEEIVFSCSICQATPPEVYATKQSNRGFHSDSSNPTGIVTRLWISTCSHVFCGEHLAGGAVPFHPDGVPPQAPCPYCQRERNDDGLRDLYAIHGLHEGEYDSIIPPEWIRCPAIKLDGVVSGMEAVRFQYNALALYARRARGYWKAAEQKQQAMESAYSKERKQRERLESQVLDMKTRLADLVKSEAKLERWEARKPVINHYLGVVTSMAEDIETMTTKLSELGFQVAGRSYAFDAKHDKYPPSIKLSVTTQDSNQMHAGGNTEHSSSSRKRKHDAYSDDVAEGDADQARIARPSSREVMPPPVLMLEHSRRTTIPAIRPEIQEFIRRPPASKKTIKIYEDQARQARVGNPQMDHGERQFIAPTHISALRHTIPMRPSPTYAALQQPTPNLHPPLDRWDMQSQSAETERGSPLLTQRHIPPRQGNQQTFPISRDVGGPSRTERRGQTPRVVYYDANYGTAAQQRGDQERPPLQPFGPSWLNQQRAPGTRAMDDFTTPPPLPTSRSPATSIASPFFRPDAARHFPEVTQRTPAIERRAVHNARTPENRPSYTAAQRYTRSMSSQAAAHPTIFQPLNSRMGPGRFAQRQSLIPGTPRNADGLFERPGRSFPQTYAPAQPQAPAHRGRVSLRLAQQSIPTASRQERTLFQIPGVRGLGSQAPQGSSHHNPQQYDTRSELFSSATRRSVRR